MTFEWTTECENAFQTLKQKLVTSPILAFIDYSLPFELHTDASTKGLGYILMQKYPDETTRVSILWRQDIVKDGDELHHHRTGASTTCGRMPQIRNIPPG